MIRVCPNCSNVDVGKLQALLPENELSEECLGECGQHEDKSFGYIDEELVIKETEEEFIKAVKAAY